MVRRGVAQGANEIVHPVRSLSKRSTVVWGITTQKPAYQDPKSRNPTARVKARGPQNKRNPATFPKNRDVNFCSALAKAVVVWVCDEMKARESTWEAIFALLRAEGETGLLRPKSSRMQCTDFWFNAVGSPHTIIETG